MNKPFSNFIELLGTFALGVIGVAIPVLTTLSIIYDWTAAAISILVVAAFLEIVGIALLAAGVMGLEDKINAN